MVRRTCRLCGFSFNGKVRRPGQKLMCFYCIEAKKDVSVSLRKREASRQKASRQWGKEKVELQKKQRFVKKLSCEELLQLVDPESVQPLERPLHEMKGRERISRYYSNRHELRQNRVPMAPLEPVVVPQLSIEQVPVEEHAAVLAAEDLTHDQGKYDKDGLPNGMPKEWKVLIMEAKKAQKKYSKRSQYNADEDVEQWRAASGVVVVRIMRYQGGDPKVSFERILPGERMVKLSRLTLEDVKTAMPLLVQAMQKLEELRNKPMWDEPTGADPDGKVDLGLGDEQPQ
jgi:hypothetical protein